MINNYEEMKTEGKLKSQLSSLLIVLLVVLMSLKLLRFIDILNFLYHFTYYALAVIFTIGVTSLMFDRQHNALDLIILIILLSLAYSSFISNDIVLYVITYILPISGYFLFRLNNIKIDIYKLFLFFSIFISLLTITEFTTENYTIYRLFDYEGISSKYLQSGSIYGSTRDHSNSYVHPLIYLIAPNNAHVIRPLGVAVSPQLSGVLLASFFLFSVSLIKNKHYLFMCYPKTIYFSLISLLIGLFLSSSGTGLLIFAVGLLILYINKKNYFLILFFAPFAIYLALFSRGYIYSGSANFLFNYAILLASKSYDFLLNTNLLIIFFGGDLSQTVDIDYLNFIARFGVIGILLFLLLLFSLMRIWMLLLRENQIDSCLIPIIFSILAANLHYDSIFRYPASFIFFIIIGYVSNRYILMSELKQKSTNEY